MKKAFKVLGYLVLGIIVLLAAALTYVKLALPNVGDAPQLTVQATPEKIARGEYLANHVTVCMDCHSKRDWTKFSGPVTPGTLGMGGDRFDESVGMP
ncbi:MAG TPA: cytochrome C, partial [Chitinophagaceae bacterium]|nr:cytochrome C [Chitinophagaceae bacterium]